MSDPVLIIGAGIAGLALAQGLHKHNIPFRLFERDPSFHSRTQGYRVRVSDGGIQTLQDHLSAERFEHLCRSCAQDVADSNVPSAVHDATVSGSEEPMFPPGKGPPQGAGGTILSADRSALREVLRQGIEGSTEHGREFEAYEQDSGGITVRFRDGSSARGSALVGADGAWSRVRRCKLPDYQLADSEGRLAFGKTELSDEFVKAFEPKPLHGLKLIRSKQQTCLLETMRFDHSLPEAPKDYVYWVLFMRREQHMPDAELLPLRGEETLQLARRLTADWLDSYSALFDSRFADASIFRVVTARPFDIPTGLDGQAEEGSRVTLVGDAAHPMPPTAALGATSGLRDAGELVKRLVDEANKEVPAAAFRVYEGEMRGYAAEALRRSLVGGRAVFGMKAFEELPLIEG